MTHREPANARNLVAARAGGTYAISRRTSRQPVGPNSLHRDAPPPHARLDIAFVRPVKFLCAARVSFAGESLRQTLSVTIADESRALMLLFHKEYLLAARKIVGS